MKLPHRRQFLHLAAGAAVLPAMPRVAYAQAYPTRPVHLLVGYPPRGTSDVVANGSRNDSGSQRPAARQQPCPAARGFYGGEVSWRALCDTDGAPPNPA
jgi:hypothetical protein